MSVDIPPEVVVASTAGSAVALRWLPGTSLLVKVANLLSGALVGIGCALFAAWYFGLSSVVGLAVISFFSGIFGIGAADKAQEFIRSVDVGRIWTALLKKLGAE